MQVLTKPGKIRGALLFIMSLLVCLNILSGCAARNGPVFHILWKPGGDRGCRVAVMPFQYTGRYPQGGLIFYKVFSTELQLAGDLWMIQEGDVARMFQDLLIFPGEKPDFGQLQTIASRLNADYLVGGTIYEMSATGSKGPHITVYLQVYDGETGRVLWDTYHTRYGADYKKVMHFGDINTMMRLMRQVSKEIVELWFEKGFSQCRNLH